MCMVCAEDDMSVNASHSKREGIFILILLFIILYKYILETESSFEVHFILSKSHILSKSR